MKKPALFILILVTLVLALSIVRIFISNQIATSGVLLGNIEEQIDTYKTQNILLSEKLYTVSSLTYIENEAEQSGFVEQQSEFVLNGQLPVAYKQ